MRSALSSFALALPLASVVACSPPAATHLPSSALTEEQGGILAFGPAGPPRPAPVRSGGALVRSARNDALYLADEDHKLVRRLALPLDVRRGESTFAPGGAPAAVLALEGRALVTVRDPGALLVLDDAGEAGLHESARIPLPADAWGLAVTPDERTAIVTSAFTGKVSAVDLETRTTRWTIDVAREPRGVVVTPDGKRAYVSHLVGPALTEIDLTGDGAPTVVRVELPAAPLLSPIGVSLDASLGYSLVLSQDGSRLFAPRHALGALGERSWFGAATVDVLLTATDRPLAERSAHPLVIRNTSGYMLEGSDQQFGAIPFNGGSSFVQPRAAVLRESTGTILVAGEGYDVLVEMNASSVVPGLKPERSYWLGQRRETRWQTASFCGAPSGVALDEEENVAYVFCRSTDDLAIVELASPTRKETTVAGMKLAESPLSESASVGRRLFFYGGDDRTSGGLGCAGCHPDGRDDGHTWHEVTSPVSAAPIFVGDAHDVTFLEHKAAGYARQTPILAGHVDDGGPYGWHGQSKDLTERAKEGFSLHRWDGGFAEADTPKILAAPIAAYLREGLTPPPHEKRSLDELETRGKILFESDVVGCASCHDPRRGYTDRQSYLLAPLPLRPGFEEDPNGAFKTPSLLSVAGTAPYFHDGSVATLEQMIASNHDRMGKTSHLTSDDRAALVAFLKTL